MKCLFIGVKNKRRLNGYITSLNGKITVFNWFLGYNHFGHTGHVTYIKQIDDTHGSMSPTSSPAEILVTNTQPNR